jgi:hypothetical protein
MSTISLPKALATSLVLFSFSASASSVGTVSVEGAFTNADVILNGTFSGERTDLVEWYEFTPGDFRPVHAVLFRFVSSDTFENGDDVGDFWVKFSGTPPIGEVALPIIFEQGHTDYPVAAFSQYLSISGDDDRFFAEWYIDSLRDNMELDSHPMENAIEK